MEKIDVRKHIRRTRRGKTVVRHHRRLHKNRGAESYPFSKYLKQGEYDKFRQSVRNSGMPQLEKGKLLKLADVSQATALQRADYLEVGRKMRLDPSARKVAETQMHELFVENLMKKGVVKPIALLGHKKYKPLAEEFLRKHDEPVLLPRIELKRPERGLTIRPVKVEMPKGIIKKPVIVFQGQISPPTSSTFSYEVPREIMMPQIRTGFKTRLPAKSRIKKKGYSPTRIRMKAYKKAKALADKYAINRRKFIRAGIEVY